MLKAALGVFSAFLALTLWAGSSHAQTVTCSGTWPPATLTNGNTASATDVTNNFNYLYNCITSITTGTGGNSAPQGRLTLLTGVPVMPSNQTGKTIIYYTPYTGNQVLIYNGTGMVSTTFPELSNVTTDSSTGNAGPAAVAANSNYDLFVWNNSGTIKLTRGPAWTSDTTRSLSISRTGGIWTNSSAITNGPGANLGTYVGTVRSDGSSQINWSPIPAATSGGGNAILGVFNAYNRVNVAARSQDSTSSWSYATPTWRPVNGSTSNRISYIDGLAELTASTNYQGFFGGGTQYVVGVNRDSTTAQPGTVQAIWNISGLGVSLTDVFPPTLGFHYLQAMEYDTGGASATQYGSGNPTGVLSAQWQSFSAQLNL